MVGVDYFNDTMQEYEVDFLLQNIPFADKNSWEQIRFNVYSIAQMFSKKQLKPSDILKFEWDNTIEPDVPDIANHDISNSDIQRLKEISKQIKQ